VNQKSTIVNRVKESALVTLDLDSLFPSSSIESIDLKDFLFKELVLREKEFRLKVKEMDWTRYKDTLVHILCSSDAIIPMWAYMLVSSKLNVYTHDIYFGSLANAKEKYVLDQIEKLEEEKFIDKSVIIKGCGEEEVSPEIYIAITKKLRRIVKSLMFGEPCSTVPVYKKKKTSHP